MNMMLPDGFIRKPITHLVNAETFVLRGTETKNFFRQDIIQGSVKVTNRFNHGTDTIYNSPGIVYEEDVDYQIDYENATIKRLPGSKIPDWSAKPAPSKSNYGLNVSNREYKIWVVYKAEGRKNELPKADELPRLKEKIKNGSPINITVLGDSISTGAEAEIKDEQGYFAVFARKIMKRNSNVVVNIDNQAIGGTKSNELTANNLTARVTGNPDLVIIGYGMNDQTTIEPNDFESNIRFAVDWIQTNFPNADIILVSGCLGNYENFYNATEQNRFEGYRIKLPSIANDYTNVGFADVTSHWETYLTRKTYHDLLNNDINHPTSYAHEYIYGEVFERFIP